MDGSATPAMSTQTGGATQSKAGGNTGAISAVVYICGGFFIKTNNNLYFKIVIEKMKYVRKILLDVENVDIEFFIKNARGKVCLKRF